MFNFCSLYSGSSGNSLYVETENTRLLIDAGVSSKKIESALTNLDVDPASINGILVTHEHSDHVQGLGTFAKKFNLPIYVNQKTLDAMPKQRDKIKEENINNIKIEEKFEIGDLQIKPFAIPHDAANPCGFNIFKGDQKISIATDIGHMTNGILKNLEDSIFVLLESNFFDIRLRLLQNYFSYQIVSNYSTIFSLLCSSPLKTLLIFFSCNF